MLDFPNPVSPGMPFFVCLIRRKFKIYNLLYLYGTLQFIKDFNTYYIILPSK